MRTFSKILIAAVIASAPTTAWADEPPVRASVEVDTSQVGEAGPVIQRRIRERSDVVLRQDGVLPAREGKDPVVWVTVFELSEDEPGYAFDLRARRGNEELLHTERFECRLCTETELVSQVETRLGSVVSELAARVAESASTEEAETVEPIPRPSETTHDHPESGMTGVGKAGIALLATGVAGLGVGIGLASRRDRPQSIATHVTTTKPPGYALIGVGLGLAVTGTVMLVVDRKRASRRTALTPTFGPEGAGLTWAGRF